MASSLKISATTGLIASRAWSVMSSIATLVVGGTLVTPAEFGVFTLATSIALLPVLQVGAGFYESLLTRRHDDSEFATSFWCMVASGLIGSLILLAISGVLLAFGFEWTLVSIVALFAIIPICWGASMAREATMIRDGCGGRLALTQFIVETIGILALIGAALCGYTLGALVAGRIANACASVIFFTLLSHLSLRGSFSVQHVYRTFAFAAKISLNRAISWCDGYGVDVMLSMLLSTTGLGLYRMGTRLYGTVHGFLILAPGVAQNAATGHAFGRSVSRMGVITQRYMTVHSAIVLPIFFALGASADTVVSLLLSPHWAEAGPVLLASSLAAPFAILSNATYAALLAMHRARQLLIISIAGMLVGLVAMTIGFAWGPTGVAVARMVSGAFLTLALFVWLTPLPAECRLAGLRSLALVLIACAAEFVVIILLLGHATLADGTILLIVRLAIANALGLAAYLILLRAIHRRAWRELLVLVRKSVPGAEAAFYRLRRRPLGSKLLRAPHAGLVAAVRRTASTAREHKP